METSCPPIPSELKNMLLEFTVSVLVEKPNDLVHYAANYFGRLLTQRNMEKVSLTTDEADAENVTESLSSGEIDSLQGNSGEIIPKTNEERIKIRNIIQNIYMFRTLDDFRIAQVIETMIPRRTNPKEIIIKQGETGDYFYVVEYGKFEVYFEKDNNTDELVMTYNNSGFFGELSLLNDTPRAATIKSVSNGLIWGMSRRAFRLTIHQSVFNKRQRYYPLFRSISALTSLSDYEIMTLCDTVDERKYEPESVLVRKGGACNGLYFVEDGEIESILLDEDGKEKAVRILPGNYFGGLKVGTRESATFKAKTEVKVAFFDFEVICHYLGACLGLIEANMITQRYKRLTSSSCEKILRS